MLFFRFCSKEQFLRKGDANASSHLALLSYVAKCGVDGKALNFGGLGPGLFEAILVTLLRSNRVISIESIGFSAINTIGVANLE
jgi:hypothetical protein